MEIDKKIDSKEIYAESYIRYLTEVLGKISTNFQIRKKKMIL